MFGRFREESWWDTFWSVSELLNHTLEVQGCYPRHGSSAFDIVEELYQSLILQLLMVQIILIFRQAKVMLSSISTFGHV